MRRIIQLIPWQGHTGILFILIFWPLNWFVEGLRTHILFFPLWLGYCLTIDGFVYAKKGHSLLTRNPKNYLLLFYLSAPLWWLFELFNQRTQNWFYVGREHFTDIQYAVLATLAFSTVIPAVFGTAELLSTTLWNSKKSVKKTQNIALRNPFIYLLSGIISLGLLLLWPYYFFGLLWISVFLIVDPINYLLGNRSLIQDMIASRWTTILSLSVGALVCGFFWEFWNFYSYPKWIYHVPHVGFWHVFEMPILGYLGYIPFSLELFALYHLLHGIIGKNSDAYLQL